MYVYTCTCIYVGYWSNKKNEKNKKDIIVLWASLRRRQRRKEAWGTGGKQNNSTLGFASPAAAAVRERRQWSKEIPRGGMTESTRPSPWQTCLPPAPIFFQIIFVFHIVAFPLSLSSYIYIYIYIYVYVCVCVCVCVCITTTIYCGYLSPKKVIKQNSVGLVWVCCGGACVWVWVLCWVWWRRTTNKLGLFWQIISFDKY